MTDSTALSPEWDRGFDEAFTDLVSNDADLVRAEFDALIAACWTEPPAPPAPPGAQPPASHPRPSPAGDAPSAATDSPPGAAVTNQRSPP